jgi:nucleoside-diphosphate-sugar epimerase
MKILITGGMGYVGSKLVPALLADGHDVTSYDAGYFPNTLARHERLENVVGDIRDTPRLGRAFAGIEAVIHLACISNDPSAELDGDLTRAINLDCFEPMVVAAKAAGIKRFIYASTSSVYGISDSPDVREDHPLVPLTRYNTYKAACEPLLLKHRADDFVCTILRPSTICGYAPRQRLDLAVNILTNLAVNRGVITVFGGQQKRPNLHIDDMVDAYRLMLEAPAEKIDGETFNVGAGNLTIMQLAEIVADLMPEPPMIDVKSDVIDTRSYQVNSDKIEATLGFKPQRTVADAVADLCAAFRAGWLPDSLSDDRYFNVQRMRRVWAGLYADAPPAPDPTSGVLSEIDQIRMRQS